MQNVPGGSGSARSVLGDDQMRSADQLSYRTASEKTFGWVPSAGDQFEFEIAVLRG
ncbi:MAG: hypothetical protein ACTIA6_01150 [Pseudoclavibacter sp.]